MKKTELMKAAAKECGLTQKTVTEAFASIVRNIKSALDAGEEVTIADFGTFRRVHKAERPGRNPKDGSAITIPAHDATVFKVSKSMCRGNA